MPLDPTLGQIMPVAFAQPQNIPSGWLLCDGSVLPIAQNQALFSLLGVRFGGDGVKTFALPDLRGRAVLGGTAGGVGPKHGSETVTLIDAQLPAHNHTLVASNAAGSGRFQSPTDQIYGTNTVGSPAEAIFATAGSGEVALASGTNVAPTGGGGSHTNMQPYLAINYLIASKGVYPSRN